MGCRVWGSGSELLTAAPSSSIRSHFLDWGPDAPQDVSVPENSLEVPWGYDGTLGDFQGSGRVMAYLNLVPLPIPYYYYTPSPLPPTS